MRPIGLTDENWPAAVGLFSGVFAKEAVIGTLNALYAQADEAKPGGEAAPAEEAAPATLSAKLAAAFATIPQKFGELGDKLFGLDMGYIGDVGAAATKLEVNSRVFGAMQSRFDGAAGAFALRAVRGGAWRDPSRAQLWLDCIRCCMDDRPRLYGRRLLLSDRNLRPRSSHRTELAHRLRGRIQPCRRLFVGRGTHPRPAPGRASGRVNTHDHAVRTAEVPVGTAASLRRRNDLAFRCVSRRRARRA